MLLATYTCARAPMRVCNVYLVLTESAGFDDGALLDRDGLKIFGDGRNVVST